MFCKSQLKQFSRLLTTPTFNERRSFAETILHLERRNMYFRLNVYSESNLVEVAKTTLDKFKREDQSTLRLIAEMEGISVDRVLFLADEIAAQLAQKKITLKICTTSLYSNEEPTAQL